MDKQRTIEQETKDTKIEHVSNTPLVASENDFESAKVKGLEQNKVNILDQSTKIIKQANGTFLVGRENSDGSIRECLGIQSQELLRKFFLYVTDHSYRSLNQEVSNALQGEFVSKQETTTTESGVERTTTVEKLVIKEELKDLKEDISFQQIIDGVDALTTGGKITFADGTSKIYLQGRYGEIRDLINRSRPKSDDIIYKQNLETFKQIIKENKEEAEQIRRQAKSERNNKNTENHGETLKKRRADLYRINAQYSQIERHLTNPQLMNKPFDASVYGIEIPIFSSEDVRKLYKIVETQDKEMTAMDEGLFNTALVKLDLEDRQNFKVYLDKVIEKQKDPSKEKYTPQHLEGFKELLRDCPWVKGYVAFPEEGKNNKEGTKEEASVFNPNSKKMKKFIEQHPEYATRKEALGKGGLAGLAEYGLDKTNMTPEQKKFRGGVGQLGLTVGAVYVGFKMLSSAFNLISKKHKADDAARAKDWARLWMPTAALFGLQATTGEGFGALIHGGK